MEINFYFFVFFFSFLIIKLLHFMFFFFIYSILFDDHAQITCGLNVFTLNSLHNQTHTHIKKAFICQNREKICIAVFYFYSIENVTWKINQIFFFSRLFPKIFHNVLSSFRSWQTFLVSPIILTITTTAAMNVARKDFTVKCFGNVR